MDARWISIHCRLVAPLRPLVRCSLLYWISACAATALSLSGAEYDLLIRNGKIVDGTGNPWFYGDIAIKKDRIAVIARSPSPLNGERTGVRGETVRDVH